MSRNRVFFRFISLFLSLWLLGLTACQQKEPEKPLPVPAPEGTIPCSPEEAKAGVAAAMEPGKVYTYTDGYLFDVTQLNHQDIFGDIAENEATIKRQLEYLAERQDTFIAVVTVTEFTKQTIFAKLATDDIYKVDTGIFCTWSLLALTPVRVEKILKSCPGVTFDEGEEILLNYAPVGIKRREERNNEAQTEKIPLAYDFVTSQYESRTEIVDALRYQHTYIIIAYLMENEDYMSVAELGAYDLVTDEEFEAYAQGLKPKMNKRGASFTTGARAWYKENFGDVIQEYLKK